MALGGVPEDSVDLDIPETLPMVWVDRGLLERAVANAVENAVKHSPPGERVLVSASAPADRVELRVVDRGPVFRTRPRSHHRVLGGRRDLRGDAGPPAPTVVMCPFPGQEQSPLPRARPPPARRGAPLGKRHAVNDPHLRLIASHNRSAIRHHLVINRIIQRLRGCSSAFRPSPSLRAASTGTSASTPRRSAPNSTPPGQSTSSSAARPGRARAGRRGPGGRPSGDPSRRPQTPSGRPWRRHARGRAGLGFLWKQLVEVTATGPH